MWIKQNYIAMVGCVVAMLTPASSPLVKYFLMPYGISVFYMGQGVILMKQNSHLVGRLQFELNAQQSALRWTRGGEGVPPLTPPKQHKAPGILIPALMAGCGIEFLYALAILVLSFKGSP